MSTPAQMQTKAKPAAKAASLTNHAQSGLVLRKCACGESAGVDGECSECREKKLTVQRRAINGTQPPAVPSSTGQPSNPGSSVQKGAGAGHHISRIRVSAVPGRMQAKLTVNEPGDKYEQEADKVAEQVMRMAVSEDSHEVQTVGRTLGLHIQRLDLEEERMHRQEETEEVKGEDAEEVLQPKKAYGQRVDITPELQTSINSIRDGGQPLPEAIRAFMEPRFGYDFGQVRIHTDARATETAQAVNAKAYTVGRDIVFRAGKYAPETLTGKELLAHELTHVVQQATAKSNFGFLQREVETRPSQQRVEIEKILVEETVLSAKKPLTFLPAEYVRKALDARKTNAALLDSFSVAVDQLTENQQDNENKRRQLVRAEARKLTRILERQFIQNPEASTLDLLPQGEGQRYRDFDWGTQDFPGNKPRAKYHEHETPEEKKIREMHQKTARKMARDLSKVRGQRRVNVDETAVMTVKEFNWEYVKKEMRPMPGQTDCKKGVCKLNQYALESFKKMSADAAKDGVQLTVLASDRDPETAEANAKSADNPSGVAVYSPHLLGLAIDFQLSQGKQQFHEVSTRPMRNVILMRQSTVHKWLFLHGANYGWYPYQNEPWHWEYNPPGFRDQFLKDMSEPSEAEEKSKTLPSTTSKKKVRIEEQAESKPEDNAETTEHAPQKSAGMSSSLPAKQPVTQTMDEEDTQIKTLNLASKAKAGAKQLKEKHPEITFTSGRRNVSSQAHAMASNIVKSKNRSWIKQTYKSAAKLQLWVDDNPQAVTVSDIAKGLEQIINAMPESQQRKISKHLSGEAFDVQPQSKDAEAIKRDIRGLPGVTKFLDKEGGLIRWHAQFKKVSGAYQPKIKHEQEADEVAEHIMQMPEPEISQAVEVSRLTKILPIHQRLSEEEEKIHQQEGVKVNEDDDREEPLQAKEVISQLSKVTPELQTRINSIRSGGQPLPGLTRRFMEPRFGYDFSKVRIHADARAAETAREVNAKAYTIGRDIVFGNGQYSPQTMTGKELLAHELTHVVQQGLDQNKIIAPSLDVSNADEPAEQEAQLISHNLHFARQIQKRQTFHMINRQNAKQAEKPVLSKNLSASIDAVNPALIIFNQPVTLHEAIAYLWVSPPEKPTAIKPDSNEKAKDGKQQRYLVNTDDFDLLFTMQHGLANMYVNRLRLLTAKGEAKLPSWVPSNIQNDIWSGRLKNKVTRYSKAGSMGDIVVWSDRSGRFYDIQVYEDFPENLEFYLRVTEGDKHDARLLQRVYTQFNADMKDFVERQGVSPEYARAEIRRINDEVFKLVIEAALGILNAGAGITAISSSARQVAEAAERTGFGSTTRTMGKEAGASTVKREVQAGAGAAKQEVKVGASTVKEEVETSSASTASTAKRGQSVKSPTQSSSTAPPKPDIDELVAQGRVDVKVIKKNVIEVWKQGGGDTPVKVFSAKGGSRSRVRGYITQEKFVQGRSPAEMEKLLGLPAGELNNPDGAIVEALDKIPSEGQFELRGYSQRPGGAAFVPGSKYPVGLGVPQWQLTEEVSATVIGTVKPGQVFRFNTPIPKI